MTRAGAAIALLGCALGCAAPREQVGPELRPGDAGPVAVEVERTMLPAAEGAGRDLLALAPARDDELARVAGESVRKSQVFDRLAARDPELAQALVDLCVLDRVVAAAAERYGIDVRDEEIGSRMQSEEAVLRLESKAADDPAFVRWIERRFGTPIATWRERLRREVELVLWRSHVIRYLARLEDRVSVRILVHDDPALLGEIREKLARGADFAALARRHSQDASAIDGGALPPFTRDAPHPIARAAFGLRAGELSTPIPLGDGDRLALVWCVQTLPARDASFADLRAEIVAELELRPVTPFEQDAFVARYCRSGAARAPDESLDSVGPNR